jgi:uncharacterized protein (TIGR03067 family)
MARIVSTLWLATCGLAVCGKWSAADSQEPSGEWLAELQGKWVVRACRQDGRVFPPLQGARLQVHEKDLIVMLPNELIKAHLVAEMVDGQRTLRCTYVLGPEKGHTRVGLYAFHRELLYICLGPPDGPQPEDLTCRRGSHRLLMVLQRENPHEWDLAR